MAFWKNLLNKPSIDSIEGVEEKLNPAQPHIGGGTYTSKEYVYHYTKAFEDFEVVNRGVNMVVDDTAEIPVVVGESTRGTSIRRGLKRVTVDKLLNVEPNLYQDINSFKRNLIMDFIFEGNVFIYFDGSHMFHLPANKVVINTSKVTYIKSYTFNDIVYMPEEIIHIKDNGYDSIFRGTSRMKSASKSISLLTEMQAFQQTFFKNGAVPGLIIKSPNTLSQKIKAQLLQSWINRYNPSTGGRRPLILDGGLEIDKISNVNFKELDFETSVQQHEVKILKALGVPPVILDSGNNANIRPNLRLFYLETILPIVKKFNFAYERYFGFTIKEYVTDIPALQPELQDQASYYSTLVNTGIITANEARDEMGYEPDEAPESDELRIPANIAGSASNPSEGGRPTEQEE